jgi:leucyl aminopeptidase
LWITIEAAELSSLERGSDANDWSRSAQAVAQRGGLAIARILESGLESLAAAHHRAYRRCGGFMTHSTRAEAEQAVDAFLNPARRPGPRVDYTIDNGSVVAGILGHVKTGNIYTTIAQLSSFPNRRYNQPSGVDAANWLKTLWSSYGVGRSDVSVALYPHAGWIQPSVVLTIQGATLPNEVVVLGGHLDSINSGGSTLAAPGADDDASGIASLTEVLRAALSAGYRPARTVKVMAYAAEEVGLRGSKEIAQAHRTAGANVVGVMQLDMTNYKASTEDIGMITDNTDPALTQFTKDLLNEYLGYTYANAACGYACSDHAAWFQQSYPSTMPFEGVYPQYNHQIHSANDTLAQSGNNATHAAKFTRLGVTFLAEVAKGTLSPSLATEFAARQAR